MTGLTSEAGAKVGGTRVGTLPTKELLRITRCATVTLIGCVPRQGAVPSAFRVFAPRRPAEGGAVVRVLPVGGAGAEVGGGVGRTVTLPGARARVAGRHPAGAVPQPARPWTHTPGLSGDKEPPPGFSEGRNPSQPRTAPHHPNLLFALVPYVAS